MNEPRTEAGRALVANLTPRTPGDGCAHQADSWFDPSICSEPCGSMHERCTDCGSALVGCYFEGPEYVEAMRANWTADILAIEAEARAQGALHERLISEGEEAARTADRPSLRAATRQMAYFLFNLGYPYDVQVRDSDGDPVLPPIEALDALIEEWRLHEVKPDTDETRDDYRDSFAIELGIDPWAAALRQALEAESQ